MAKEETFPTWGGAGTELLTKTDGTGHLRHLEGGRRHGADRQV